MVETALAWHQLLTWPTADTRKLAKWVIENELPIVIVYDYGYPANIFYFEWLTAPGGDNGQFAIQPFSKHGGWLMGGKSIDKSIIGETMKKIGEDRGYGNVLNLKFISEVIWVIKLIHKKLLFAT